MIYHNFKKFNDRTALISQDNRTYSYSDILRFKEVLKKNFKKRSLTILLSDNSVESVMIYVSLVIIKMPILLLNSSIRISDLNLLIKKFRIQNVLQPIKFEFNNKLFVSKKCILEKFLLSTKKNYQNIEIDKNLMLVLPSSGTMSESKLIKLSYQNYYQNTKSIVKYLKLNQNDRSITTMPSSYSYGLSVINSHLMIGGSMVVGNFSLVDKKFWDMNSFYKPTNINGVPFFYDMLCKIGLSKLFNDKIKFFTVAGGKLNLKTFKKISKYFYDKKIKFFLMYGQTEASPRIAYHLHSKKDKDIGEVPTGKPIPGAKIYLYDSKNKMIKKNNVEGEIVLKGPNIFGGYASSVKDLSTMEKNKYLFTGDLGKFDNKKILYITGRKSRIVKVFGYRINLDQLESKISDANNKIACIEKNEKIYIFTKKKIDLVKYVGLPNNSFKIVLLNKIPKTENGKISYKDLLLQLKDD